MRKICQLTLQGADCSKMVDRQAQEQLEQQLADAIERLDIVNADLAATQIEKAGKDEMLEEYANMTAQLESQLQQSSANISSLKELKERLEKDLTHSVNAIASAESQLADERNKHKVCQEQCGIFQKDLARIQVHSLYSWHISDAHVSYSRELKGNGKPLRT